jgi:hypothetical protein
MAQLIKKAQPGDVITAADWNLVVDAINELLQSGQQTGITIAASLPAGTQIDPFRIGQTVQITGQNFGYAIGQSKVTFVSIIDNSVVATVFRANMLEGSFDGRLLFLMPPIPNLPLDGQPMTMRVSNGVAEDHRSVYVMPVVNELAGDMFVTFRSDIQGNPEPNPILSLQGANFRYRLQTGINMPANFTLTAEIPGAPGTQMEIRDELGNLITNNQIQMGTNDVKNILVRVLAVPTGQSFTLRVTAGSSTVVGTDQRTFPIGTPAPLPDPNIEANQTGFTLIDVASGNVDTNPQNGSLEGSTIKLKIGKRGVVAFTTKFTLAGTYDVTIQPKQGATLLNWAPEITNDSVGTRIDLTTVRVTVQTNNDQTTRTEKFRVSPIAGATQTGAVVFRIKRQGAASEFFKEYAVQLLP